MTMSIGRLKRIIPKSIADQIRDLKMYRSRVFSRSARMLPDYLIIGAARSGTTSLFFYLGKHPNIRSSIRKEIHFFDSKYHRGLNWYRMHFPLLSESRKVLGDTGHPLLVGEATPTYLFHPIVPSRVAKDLPSVKLIVLLRNPVERAYSSYSKMVKMGIENLSFEEALSREDEILENNRDPQHGAFYYKTRGVYIDQLKRWFKHFPRERFLILKSEELFVGSTFVFEKTLEFLNLHKIKLNSFPAYNASANTKMNLKTRQELMEYFTPHNDRLKKLLGGDWGWE